MLMKLWKAKLKNKKGFTLIELIVVVAIIAILLALLVPNVLKFIQTSKLTAANGNAKLAFVAAQAYLTDQYVTNPSNVTGTFTLDGGQLAEYMDGGSADATIEVECSNGAAVSATWTRDGVVGSYPDLATSIPTTPPAPGP